PHVLPRAGARRRLDPLQEEGDLRRVLHLLRIARVLRRLDRRVDAGPAQAHRAGVRRSVHRARPGGDRVDRGLLVPPWSGLSIAVSVRLPQLRPDPREPDPAAGAGWLLDPVGSDPGPRPPTARDRVRAGRPVAQAPDPGTVHPAGHGARPVRHGRVALHDLLLLDGLPVLAAHLRRHRQRPLARWSRIAAPAARPAVVLRWPRDPRPDLVGARDDEARAIPPRAAPVPITARLADRGRGADRSAARVRRPPRGRALRPGGPRPPSRIPARTRRGSPGRPRRSLLRASPRTARGRGRASRDG